MSITQKSRWDDVGTQPPANQAHYVAGQQPIAEYDNWINKAVVDDVAALDAAIDTHVAKTTVVHGISASGFEDKANKNAASGYAALDAVWGIPHHINKVASAAVRNSHDAELCTSTAGAVYPLFYKLKKITLINGLHGQQRFLFDLRSQTGGAVYAQIYRNGTAIGTLQTDSSGIWVTKSEDITQNWGPGDTCELHVSYSADATAVCVRNFRIAYDDAPIVAVASANS